MMRRLILWLGFAVLAITAVSADDKWPQFRGPQAGVVPDDPALPDAWSATENVVWKTDVPGRGWSSPVVWREHVFVTAVVSTAQPTETFEQRRYGAKDVATAIEPHRWMLYDIDIKTGRIRWEREAHNAVPSEPRHLKNSYASETPVTDGERVYAYFGGVGLFAFDMNGKPVWSKPIGPFKTRTGWGFAASPVLHKDRVYIVCDNEEQSFIAAFNKQTGAEIWRVNRQETSNWATPFVWENETRTEIVTAGSARLRSYDLDGKLLWELSGMSTIDIPTPFAANGLLYLNSGYIADQLRPVYAIRPGASGDISLKTGETSNKFIAWSDPTLGSYNPSSLVYGDYYYTLHDRGFLTCNDAKTGRQVYDRQRIAADATGFTASPWAYNGRIFVLSEDGDTYVIQPGPEFKVLGKNTLNEMTLATPAIASGSLFVRTASKLYRISKSAVR